MLCSLNQYAHLGFYTHKILAIVTIPPIAVVIFNNFEILYQIFYSVNGGRFSFCCLH